MLIQLWTINGKCPKNSIPIRRTRREDILRTKSVERYGKKDPNIIPKPKHGNSTSNSIHEVDILFNKHLKSSLQFFYLYIYVHLQYAQIKVDGKFHGAKADINVWKPYIQTPKEFSLAQMWVLAGPYSEINSIEVGWQVLVCFFQLHFHMCLHIYPYLSFFFWSSIY